MIMLLLMGLIGQSPVLAAGSTGSNPWEVWNYDQEKPVRGGTYIMAATTEVGLFNANHWPIMDWVSILFFYDPFFLPDGSRRSHPFLVPFFQFVFQVTKRNCIKYNEKMTPVLDLPA